jgi:hypothetical protein
LDKYAATLIFFSVIQHYLSLLFSSFLFISNRVWCQTNEVILVLIPVQTYSMEKIIRNRITVFKNAFFSALNICEVEEYSKSF